MSRVKVLYCRNLAAECSEDDLREIFEVIISCFLYISKCSEDDLREIFEDEVIISCFSIYINVLRMISGKYLR